MSGRREYLCYTDGSCKAGEGAPGGWGFVIRPPDSSEPTIEGSGKQTNTLAKVMEYEAVARALAALPERVSAIVFSDNLSLVENLSKKLEVWRGNGFAKVDPLVVECVRSIDASIGEKQLAVTFQWVKSHNGNPNNEHADALAAEAAREAKADVKRGR